MYKYRKPEGKKVFLTKKQHNKLFPKRIIKFIDHYDYYLSDDMMIVEKTLNIFGIILYTLVLPIGILYNISEAKNTLKEYSEILNQKKSGHFECDSIESSKKLDEIKNILQL